MIVCEQYEGASGDQYRVFNDLIGHTLRKL
jgi:hypothetical protein